MPIHLILRMDQMWALSSEDEVEEMDSTARDSMERPGG